MAWAAVETNVLTSPAGRRLSASARLMWLAGRLHCAEFETDGVIEASALPLLLYASAATEPVDDLAAELVKVGWWAREDFGWVDVNFLKSNRAREVRERRRAADAAKKQRQRQGQRPRGTSLRAVPLGHPEGLSARQERERRGENNTGELLSGDTARSPHPVGSPLDSENSSGDRARRPGTHGSRPPSTTKQGGSR